MKKLHVGGRQGRGDPPLAHSDQDEGPGLLASPYFWVGGAISLAIWCYLVQVMA